MSSTVIKNNIPAMIVLGTLAKNSGGIDKSLKKASSGEKLTSAEDDASAWSISERMRVKMRSIGQATQNAQNDNSLMQTAEGALNSTLDILRNLKEKAINSANDANTDDDRHIIQKEVDGLIDQVDDNALVTFNGKHLIDGTHNSQTNSLLNSFANESLGNNMADPLVNWTNKNGDSLEIQSTDKIIISAVWQGKAFVSPEPQEIGDKNIVTLLEEWKSDTGIGDGVLWSTNRNFYGKDGQGREVPTPGGSFNRPPSPPPTGAPLPPPPPGDKTAEIISPRISTSQTDYNVPPDDTTIGLDHQFGSFNLSIVDAQGNVRKTVNRYIDNFKEVIRAQNKTDDNSLNFHVGADANVAIKFGFANMTAKGLALKGPDGTKIQVTTKDAANAAIGTFDTAISRVLDEQTRIGAARMRLEYAVSNLTISNDNVQNAESTIRDADMAKEMVNYTRNNVMMQASQAMLAQANQKSSDVLGLLQ